MSTTASKPLAGKPEISQFRKRLIVLCDGTGQDSTANDHTKPPTNVTRFGRAISPWTEVETTVANTSEPKKEQVEQIVYYQKGVGTNSWLDKRATGAGVAANVRAAYGFLAHNYDPGDEIYFFGYSRGAYTARAIADMVIKAGLLKKRGMDAFTKLYKTYSDQYLSGSKADAGKEGAGKEGPSDRLKVNGIEDEWYHEGADRAVRIVGVWDTVEFHKPGPGRSFGYPGEEIKFENNELSPHIPFGFHALALDERRKAFSPTLWKVSSGSQSEDNRSQHIKQVWFSGRHSDIGGGCPDPSLSNITLAWMIAECEETKLLGFDHSYCRADDQVGSELWDTARGATAEEADFGDWVYHLADWIPFVETLKDRELLSEDGTPNGEVHASIEHRNLGKNPKAKDAKHYPCNLLTGDYDEGKGWRLRGHQGKWLEVAHLNDLEEEYRGKVRRADT
ncbi:hypothetical protein H2201_005322 [Coniosporium apollinis]|uniref:T6SS Phospholipase effector Tle1-like catalytic domain-containing protein n=1 Tax=Coniosporium apollinis TaxID=61459 RepID=A0ABQ9NS66_9PEZI|nr:hypothetical protein H2201_005322 [Coniosporium apollinis]